MKKWSSYYYRDLRNFSRQILPPNKSSLIIKNLRAPLPRKKFDYLFLPNTLSYVPDVQDFLKKLRKLCHADTRLVVIYFNFLWKSILDLASLLKLRRRFRQEPNWLTPNDIKNLFALEKFQFIKGGSRFLLPIDLGPVSRLVNQYLAPLPFFNPLCLSFFQIYKPPGRQKKGYSVSLIIPARNEAGNIKGILTKIPSLGTKTEIIFVEGHSLDQTYQTIAKEIRQNKNKKRPLSLFKQEGIGKADAVRLGLKKARGEVLIIFDADLTVSPRDLTKFYEALASGVCDLANGSRLVYPLEKQAMRYLNYWGNSIFSHLFTFLIGQPIRDTLCGTKALFRKDYLEIIKNREFGNFDPFGDYELLFGASRLNLKIRDIPVRYHERTYGKTNISRFTHGWLLLKMTLLAARKLKFV